MKDVKRRNSLFFMQKPSFNYIEVINYNDYLERGIIMNKVTLNNTEIGQKTKVLKIINDNSIKRRLLDMGLTPGTTIETVLKNYGGNLVAYMIRGALVAIRNEDAEGILVEVI